MKIIQVLPEMNAGGVERGTLEIASYLVQHGHEAVVISNGGGMVTDLEAAGVRHITQPVHRKSPASLLQVGAMRRSLVAERADIVHVRSRVPAWITWLAWRGMDPKTRPHLVSTVHGFYSVSRYSAVMTRGERVIAVSESVRRYVLENYPATPPGRIRVIPRGIDPLRYRQPQSGQPDVAWLQRWQAAHPELRDKCLLLLPGRITRLKGHEDFFRLISALNHQGIPAHGLIAGDTHPRKRSYLSELHALVSQLGLGEQITFLGQRSDLREVMAVSDIVCALSQQPEAFGRTVLEALAIGKPVAGYDCGGVGELLAGLFPQGRVPPGDHNRLVQAVAAILRERPTPAPVGHPYTLDAMCSATLAVYQELAGPPR